MNNQPDTIRSFIAIELPPDVQALLAAIQDDLRERLGEYSNAVRWSKPEGTHLTLLFLGDVPAQSVTGVVEAVGAACAGKEPFTLRLGGLGVFPNLRRPRVIWVGLEGDSEAMSALEALYSALAKRLGALGYKADKDFTPHLTLGRVRENAGQGHGGAIAEAVAELFGRAAASATFRVETVTLMRSDLQPSGSVYTPLAHMELG